MRGLPPNPLLTQFRKLQPSPLEVGDHLIFVLVDVYWVSTIHRVYQFFVLENVLSPEGAAKAEPKVVQLFLLMFYPPGSKSVALQLGVHLILLYFIRI